MPNKTEDGGNTPSFFLCWNCGSGHILCGVMG